LIQAGIHNADAGRTNAWCHPRPGRPDARCDADTRRTDPNIARGARLVQSGIRPRIARGTGLVDATIARERSGRRHRQRCKERRTHPAACLVVHL
jgi:hypothetical protein